MRVHITELQGIGVMAIFQCRLLHSALMMVSTQASLLNNLIRSLKQLILRKIASFNVGTSKKKKKKLNWKSRECTLWIGWRKAINFLKMCIFKTKTKTKMFHLSFTSQSITWIFVSLAFWLTNTGSADCWIWSLGEISLQNGSVTFGVFFCQFRGCSASFFNWGQEAMAWMTCWSNPSWCAGDVC